MAEPSLGIFGQDSTQDAGFFYISKNGLADKVEAIAIAEGEDSVFIPTTGNTAESFVACIIICLAAEMTQEKRDADTTNVQIVVSSIGKSMETLGTGEENLVFRYQVELYQPVNLPGLNPDSY